MLFIPSFNIIYYNDIVSRCMGSSLLVHVTHYSIKLSNFPEQCYKKKYYDFIQNFPLFIPVEEIGNTFSKILDKYPVTPYLDSRESFMRWMHFIHNKLNVALELPSLTMEEAMSEYYKKYKPKAVESIDQYKRREKVAFIFCVLVMIMTGWFFYKE